jgi:hypothetical protein
MTKLEELTTLLVNEINDFKNGVEKLEKFNDQLKETKIKMDLTKYKSMIETHQQKMESHLNVLKSFENRFDSKLKGAKIYPNWAVVVFIIAVLFGVATIVVCWI